MRTILFTVLLLIGLVAAASNSCSFSSGDQRWSALYPSLAAGDNVTIADGTTVWFDVATTPVLFRITIEGNLFFDGSAKVDTLNLNARQIYVRPGGAFAIGCASKPFSGNADVILYGKKAEVDSQDPDIGTKVLHVAGGGTLEFFGADAELTWTNLAQTANITWVYNYNTNGYSPVGASSITVADDVSKNWFVGDTIVVASTDYDGRGQSERRNIAGINKNVITLDKPLTYMHWGQIWRGDGDDYVDMRAEVIHLTRNIKLHGDTTDGESDDVGFGGHMMATHGSVVHLSGVEVFNMGQSGLLARYPIHFHLGLDMTGNYVENCSIHDTYQRCITIHWSHYLQIVNNVAFNITCHCFFLEDAIEQNNTFINNVGIAVYPPNPARVIVGSDALPTVFWVTNPMNHYIGNVAVGAEFGWWYATPPHPTGKTVGAVNQYQYWPRNTPLGTFLRNKAHGHLDAGVFMDKGGTTHDAADTNSELTSYAPRNFWISNDMLNSMTGDQVQSYVGNSPLVYGEIVDFTAYKCSSHGLWGRGQGMHVIHAMVADNQIGVQYPGDANMCQNSVFVGDSDNVGNPWAQGWPGAAALQGRSRFYTWAPQYPVLGYRHYDCCGPDFVMNNHFYNFVNETFAWNGLVRIAAAIGPDRGPNVNPGRTKHITPTFKNVQNRYFNYVDQSPNSRWVVGQDTDGTITKGISKFGGCGAWLTQNTPILLNDMCEFINGWNTWICQAETSPARRMFYMNDQTNKPVTVTTDSNGNIPASSYYQIYARVTRLYDGVSTMIGPGQSKMDGPPSSDGYYYTNKWDRSYQFKLICNQHYLFEFPGGTPSVIQINPVDMVGGNAYNPGPDWFVVAVPYPKDTTFASIMNGNSNMTAAASKDEMLATPNSYFWDNAAGLMWTYIVQTGTDSYRWDYGVATANNYRSVVITANCANSNCGDGNYATYSLTGPAPVGPFRSECQANGGGYPGGDLTVAVTDASATYNMYSDGWGLGWLSWDKSMSGWAPLANLTANATRFAQVLPNGVPSAVTGNPMVMFYSGWGGSGFQQNDLSQPAITAAQTHLTFDVYVLDGIGKSQLYVHFWLRNTTSLNSAPVSNPWYINNGPLTDSGKWWSVAIPLADLELEPGMQPYGFYLNAAGNKNTTVFVNNLKIVALSTSWAKPANPQASAGQGSSEMPEPAAATGQYGTSAGTGGAGSGSSKSTSGSSGSKQTAGSALDSGSVAAIVMSTLLVLIVIALVVVIIVLIKRR